MTLEKMPTRDDLLWPTLKALAEEGGSASIQELAEHIAQDLLLSEDILNVPHKNGPRSEVDYRAAWARTYLKHVGEIDNTSRGVWTITSTGKAIQDENELNDLVADDRAVRHQERRKKTPENLSDIHGKDDLEENQNWEDSLLEIIRAIKPDAFERLCQLLLRESGFTKVEVTGRAGDGGIDGAGVLRVNLISFHVRFQCKRYSGSVRAGEIRDFRGAMVGRADKGLFITTGRFTRDAEKEATRDGAPAIDLIDGISLCTLLRKLELGVTTESVITIKTNSDFFKNL